MFDPGDLLIFQLESGYGVMRVLARTDDDGGPLWQLRVYEDLFLETADAEAAVADPETLRVAIPHTVLTERAFESTPVAKLSNHPLTEEEESLIKAWQNTPDPPVRDRSIRLLLGLR